MVFINNISMIISPLRLDDKMYNLIIDLYNVDVVKFTVVHYIVFTIVTIATAPIAIKEKFSNSR